MLHSVGEHIAECLARAAEARRRAEECLDPVAKENFADIARRWIFLADSYQFVERVDRFLTQKSEADPSPASGTKFLA